MPDHVGARRVWRPPAPPDLRGGHQTERIGERIGRTARPPTAGGGERAAAAPRDPRPAEAELNPQREGAAAQLTVDFGVRPW